MTREELVEKVARAIIEADGNDPDLCLDDDGEPWWKDYTPNARAVLASLAASGYAVVPVEATATHKKRGTTYDVISGLALVQTDEPLTDMAEVVIYRCRETGAYWVRRHSEFYDGRFEIPAAQEDSHE